MTMHQSNFPAARSIHDEVCYPPAEFVDERTARTHLIIDRHYSAKLLYISHKITAVLLHYSSCDLVTLFTL